LQWAEADADEGWTFDPSAASDSAYAKWIGLCDPTTVLALLAVVDAAANLDAHILGGLESRTHLPGDLCVRQLRAALDALGEARDGDSR